MTEKLITISDASAAAAEAYRALRTNIIFNDAVEKLSALLVTMPAPESNSGSKATLAAN